MQALYDNPTSTTFSWNIAGQAGPVNRQQIVTELNNRSGQGDTPTIVSGSSASASVVVANKTTGQKTTIR